MTVLVVLTVLEIVVLIAALAFYLFWVGTLLARIAGNLEECAEIVRGIVADAALIGPGVEHINETGGVVAGALPLLYGMAEEIVADVTPRPEPPAVPEPARPASGTRRSRLLDAVGFAPRLYRTDGHWPCVDVCHAGGTSWNPRNSGRRNRPVSIPSAMPDAACVQRAEPGNLSLTAVSFRERRQHGEDCGRLTAGYHDHAGCPVRVADVDVQAARYVPGAHLTVREPLPQLRLDTAGRLPVHDAARVNGTHLTRPSQRSAAHPWPVRR